MKKILILGGSGFVGSHLCEKLAGLQIRATIAVRRAADARHLQMLPMVDLAEVRAHDSVSLAALVAGHDAVVNLVGLLHGSEKDFEKAHVELPLELSRACDSVGVRRIIHISALGASADSASKYQRSKARGEKVLRDAGLDLTVIRPSVMFGSDDKFLNTFVKLQQMFPVIPLASAGAKFQPVWVEDVASAIIRCLQEPSTIGKTYEAVGPEVFTLKQLVEMAGRYAGINDGQGRPVFGLPGMLGRLQAAVLELAPGEPMMSRDNLDAMKTDNVATGSVPGIGELGIKPTAISAVAPFYLGAQGLRSGLMAKRKTAGRF